MSDLMMRAVIMMPLDLAMSSELSRMQFHSRAQDLLVERDTYRDLCAELLGALRINREAMSMVLNGETLEWHTGRAAVSAHDIAIQSITKAESILGEIQ